MSDLTSLLEAIREGRAERLGREQVYELLAWLAGNREDLGVPEHDPVLNQMVLFRLDAALFREGRLDLHVAGVGPDVPVDERKARFRRLASVFHPDRFPALADWLTLRSQAVHTAYGAFKKNPHTAPESVRATTAPPRPEPSAPPAKRKPRRPGFIKRNLLHLRHRFGHDRYLAHKLIGGLALIALLPVINLLLAPGPQVETARGTSGVNSETAGDAAGVSSEQFSVSSETRSRTANGSTAAAPAAAEVPETRNPNAETAIARGASGVNSEQSSVSSEPHSAATTNSSTAAPAAAEVPEPRTLNPETSNAIASEASPPNDPPTAAETTVAVPESSLSLAAREALRPSRTESAMLPSVDAQLAALGLPTDEERLNRRFEAGIRATNGQGARGASGVNSETVGDAAGVNSETARGASGVSSEQFSVSSETRSRTANGSTAATPAAAEVPETRTLNPETSIAIAPEAATEPEQTTPNETSASPAVSLKTENRQLKTPAATAAATPTPVVEVPEPRNPNPETAIAKAPETSSPNESTAPAETTIAAAQTIASAREAAQDNEPAAPAEAAPTGELTLGPLRFHPAGELLTAFQSALEAGDVLALRRLFDTPRPADRYVDLIRTTTDRAVDLRVDRMRRNGDRWQIDLALTLRSPDLNHLYPSTTFMLAEHPDGLRIVGVEE